MIWSKFENVLLILGEIPGELDISSHSAISLSRYTGLGCQEGPNLETEEEELEVYDRLYPETLEA